MYLSSNPTDDEGYSIQHYVIKFVSDLRQVFGFLRSFDFIHQQNLQGSCCLRCIFLLLEISKMIALFHLAIVLYLVLFTALVDDW
jgi:hypothetical protein